jgi:hypothetical protein
MLLMLGVRDAVAQPIHLPPRDIAPSAPLLRTFAESGGTQLHLTVNTAAETNVQPLLTDRPPPFHAPRAYLHSFRSFQLSVGMKRWLLSYSYGESDLYEGNGGAAQLYQEAKQGALDVGTTYPVRATLNRSAVNAFSVAYRWETPATVWTLAAHWLLLRRVQLGQLMGQKQADQFTGNLVLDTTRGIDPEAVDGWGVALDAALLWHPTPQWSVGIKIENLFSYLHLGAVQHIQARVNLNRPEPDPDGFLHLPPVLEGRTETRSLTTHAALSYQGMLAYRQASSCYAVVYVRDFRWRIGLAFAKADRLEWWWMVWLERPEWRLGVRSARWELSLGFDHPNWSLAKRLSARINWSLPL